MYGNPVPISMYPRDKDHHPRILTAGRARQRRDSNESSLTLSRDKRRGRVARNTTHSSVHSCPVSSFSGRPCALRPLSSSMCCSIHCVCNTALFPHPRRSHGPISPTFVSSSLFPPLSLPPDRSPLLPPLASPSSTPGVFCLIILSARTAGRYISPSTRHSLSLLLAAIPAYKHRGFIWTFYSGRGPCRPRRPTGITPKKEESRIGADSLSRTKRSRAGVEQGSTAYASSTPSRVVSMRSSFCLCPSLSSFCPLANYNVRLREFLPLSRAIRAQFERRRDRCSDKSSRPSSQDIVKRKEKNDRRHLHAATRSLSFRSSHCPSALLTDLLLKTLVHFLNDGKKRKNVIFLNVR